MKFDEFYSNNREKIYFYVLKRVQQKELAEDLSAEVFFRTYRDWTQLEARTDSEKIAWVYTVSRNLTIDYYKKKKASSLEFEPESDDESIMSEIIKDENKKELHEAISQLSKDKQELLELRFGQELKFQEISEILGKKEAACKMMLYRTLEELKVNLAEIRKNVQKEK